MPPLHSELRTRQMYKYDCENATGEARKVEIESPSAVPAEIEDSTAETTPMIMHEQQSKEQSENDIAAKTKDGTPATLNGTSIATGAKTKVATGDGERKSSAQKYINPWFMILSWVFGSSLVSFLSYKAFRSIPISVVAFLVPVSIALLQGALHVLRFRLKFGDSPLPKAPSHGVVKCQGKVATDSVDGESDTNSHPLRLLVIGDSLAIGVGQKMHSTPILPETMAKSLSKAMGGRPVMWTCHGAPGASAGWIVRELERSIQHGRFFQASNNAHHQMVLDLPLSPSQEKKDGDSSSDESSTENSECDEEKQTWQERLRQERIHFDPNVLGPFDIAVVMTGPNDLKSVVFPFLLTGEDAEFRKQAWRHGGYGKELARILQVLNRRMRERLHTMRDQMEAATGKMRERLGSVDSTTSGVLSPPRRTPTSSKRVTSRITSPSQHDELIRKMQDEFDDCFQKSSSSLSSASPLFPMVVLPGMPARALPIFQRGFLRWLSVPLVDIMDSFKRKIAKRHDGEVLFIDAPTPEQMTEYSEERGPEYEDEQDEHVLLNLRDIKNRHARRIETNMKDYYALRTEVPSTPEMKPLRQSGHLHLMSADGIHPNDGGYIFWGRQIAGSIVQEWRRRQAESLPEQLNPGSV